MIVAPCGSHSLGIFMVAYNVGIVAAFNMSNRNKSVLARQVCDLRVFAFPPVTAIRVSHSDGVDLQHGEHQRAKSLLSELALGGPAEFSYIRTFKTTLCG